MESATESMQARPRRGAEPAPETTAKAALPQAEGKENLREKRRLLLLVRTGLTLAIGYLLVFSSDSMHVPPAQILLVVLYLGSNLIIALLPDRYLARAPFDIGLILTDTAVISLALYLLPNANTDVFVFYFVIILLASISDRMLVTILAPVVTCIAYLAFLLARHGLGEVLQPAILLRLPFFLLAGAFYGFFVDRVRRGQAAAIAARQREMARTEFLSLITHDLKQPLWAAQQSAAILYDQLGEAHSPERTMAAQVMVNLRRMEALTLNFLNFARIESRGMRVVPRQVSLNRIIQDLFDVYGPSFELKKLRVHLELAPDLPAAWVDPQQIERSLANLLDNAVKFTPEGGEITCRTRADGAWAETTIGDSGPGVAPERAAHLFAQFQSGAEVRGRRSTGLGLYIAGAIVDAHGGAIELDRGASKGAWFRIRLPLSASPGASAGTQTEASSSPSELSGRAAPAAVGWS